QRQLTGGSLVGWSTTPRPSWATTATLPQPPLEASSHSGRICASPSASERAVAQVRTRSSRRLPRRSGLFENTPAVDPSQRFTVGCTPLASGVHPTRLYWGACWERILFGDSGGETPADAPSSDLCQQSHDGG